jgi:predicted O-methyltransferase YrrM
MNRHQKEIHKYCSNHSTPQSDILYELERETYLKTLAPQMMSGHLQGRFLSLLSKMQRPRRVLELGVFTGYATLCLAEGLAEDGIIHAIEGNPELEYIIHKYVKKAGLEDKVKLHIGDAKVIAGDLDETFDLVFIDAGKRDYAFYYDLIIEKVNSGGILLADNVLWSGKVISGATDADTQLLDAFNKKVNADPRVENIIMPLRDGLTIIRKK